MPKIYQLLTDEIEEFVLQYINEHQLKPHDKLPTERELSTSLNVNRITLRNGLQKLIDKGMIYSHRGKGYFVCPQKINRTLCYFSFPEADSLLKDHSYKAEAQNFLPTIIPIITQRMGGYVVFNTEEGIFKVNIFLPVKTVQ